MVLYDGDYSETQIMDRIIQQLVESKTDLTVTIKDQMSQVNNYNALKGDGHSCDMMISYDGTLLTTFLKKDVYKRQEKHIGEHGAKQPAVKPFGEIAGDLFPG